MHTLGNLTAVSRSTSRRRSTTSTTRRTSATPTRRSPPTRWPAGTGCSATTSFFLTGTDEHGLKVQRAAEATASRPRSRPTAPASGSARPGTLLDITYDDFIRTTEPRHHDAGAGQFLQAVYDNGDIELGTYEGLYCVVVRGLLHRGRPGRRRTVPDPRPPGRAGRGGELLLPALRFEQPLLDWYEAHPDAVQPEGKRNEALGLHPAGPARLLDQPHVDRLGRPGAVGPEPRHLRLVRRAHQLRHRRRLRQRRPSASPPGGRRSTTSSARTSSGSTASTGRRCSWPPGSSRPQTVFVHGFLLVGGEKMSKTRLNQIAPADLVDGLRRRRVPLPLPARHAVRARRRLLLRAHGRPLQRRPRQQPRQPAVPGGHRGRQEVRRHRPGAARRQPAGRRRRRGRRGAADAWANVQPSVALEATWRLIRETNAHLEANEPWKCRARPGGRRRARATPSRRCASSPCSPGRPSRRLRRDLAAHRPGRLAGRPAPAPAAAAGAATPAGSPSRRARRSSPASSPTSRSASERSTESRSLRARLGRRRTAA